MSSLKIERSRSETLHEEVLHTTLPGGLPVYFCPKPGFRKKYACYSSFYGSVDQRFRGPGDATPVAVPDGIAHFLEHTLFETEKGNVSDLFAQQGAYNNASTSFSATTYLFASSERFYENLALLIDFVENPVFDPEKVEKEKGIIEQEILGYRDDPTWVGYLGLLEALFQKHPLRIDIAGTVESIHEIDSGMLHRCYRTFYAPQNMILFVIGDLRPAEVFSYVDQTSRHGSRRHDAAAATHGGPIERFYPEEPPGVASERFEVSMEVALPKLLVGFKETGVPPLGRDLLERELVTEFALDLLLGSSSDAFTELYVPQLILDDFSASYYACAGVGSVVIGGDAPRPEELLEALDEILARARDAEIPAEDFERAKRKFIGGFVRSFNSLEFIANHYTYHRFHGLDLFDVVDILEEIGREDIEARLRELFDPARRAVSLIRPR